MILVDENNNPIPTVNIRIGDKFIPIACKNCGKVFTPKCSTNIFCCYQCGKAFNKRLHYPRNKKKVKCFNDDCHKKFFPNRGKLYCCPKCRKEDYNRIYKKPHQSY